MPDIGILLPVPRIGIPITNGLKLFTYVPGTTTKRSTYTESSLAVANNNPLSADANGLFPNVFIDPALGYKIVIAPSTDTDPPSSPVLTVDNAYLPGAHVDALVCQGRLTLTSATPITTADVTAATTIYFTPYGGSSIALYNTTKLAWEIHAFAEVSLALTGLAASTPYDVFVYDNAGTKTLEQVAWSSDTARATALALQNGVLVKNGSANKRYVGTFRTTSTIGQTEDSLTKRFVWNYYHRVRRLLRVIETTDSWTYTTATYRQANGATANKVELVIGVAEEPVSVRIGAMAANSTGGVAASVAVGEDSITVPTASQLIQAMGAAAANIAVGLHADLRKYPAIGYHFYAWLEISTATGTTTWYGDNGGATLLQSGLHAEIAG